MTEFTSPLGNARGQLLMTSQASRAVLLYVTASDHVPWGHALRSLMGDVQVIKAMLLNY